MDILEYFNVYVKGVTSFCFSFRDLLLNKKSLEDSLKRHVGDEI